MNSSHKLTTERITYSVKNLLPTGSVWVIWGLILFLTAFSLRANAQSAPSSLTISGACLNGTYTLTKLSDNFETTGRPAYTGAGDVSIGGTTYTGVSFLLYYVSTGPAWALAFDGQPYQQNPSTSTLPPMSGWTAVTDGVVGPCTGSSPFSVNYTQPTVSLALSAASVCSSSPLSVTATAAGFSAPITGYTLSSSPAGLTGSNTSGVFALNAPSVSSTTTYTLTVGATSSSGSASATAVVTVNPAPSPPTVNNLSYCQNDVAQPLTATASSGATLRWYTTSTGGTFSSVAPTPPTTSPGTFTYYVSQVSGSGCESSRATITVQVNSRPNAPTVQDVSYCQNAVAQPLSATASPGATLRWYTSSTGGAFSSIAPTPPTTSPATFTYYVSQINSSGCESPRATVTVTVNPTPVPPTVSNVSYCQGATAAPLTATGTNLKFYTTATGGSALSTPVIPQTSSPGIANYYVSQTNSSGCESARANLTVTINPLPTVAITGLADAYCQDAPAVTLTGSPSGGSFTVDGAAATIFNPASLTVGTHTVVYSYTDGNGCSNTASKTVTVKEVPTAPTLVTQSGQSYPGGVSSLTASQNTGSVILTVSGCAGGTISWNGGNSTTLAVSTENLGPQSFTATCTRNGCTSPIATATVTVVPTTLGVLHRDAGFGNTQDNIIQPFLQLSNASNEAIPYGEITVRYWFTSEGNAPPTDFAVYFAPLGTVQMSYVALSQPRQGATGYVEYRFPGGGNLPALGNSGPIENGIQKTDRSNFNESDDYSYAANYANYVPNARITAYRNGVIFWGQEPAVVPTQTVVSVYSAAKDSPITSQIQTRVEVRNEGNTSITVSDLKVRYYFSSDNGQLANVYVDYADIGAANVQAQVVQLPSPVNGADSYVELTFAGSSLVLAPQSSLGAIDFRIVRSDFGLLDQNNDYSYAANYGNVGLNNRITAYLSNNLVFGTAPSGALARIAASEPSSLLKARVLGNPVVGASAEVEISGTAGQSVNLKLVDLQGRALHEQRIEQTSAVERVLVPMGQSHGQLLLKVSTANQQQHLKLLRP